ncbi:hypothetical protein CGL27_09890 [Streptomyces sp. 11-1-2]|nr:hypothetical protein CGL27_09890 [Streptomyces sp. 11-1-2]
MVYETMAGLGPAGVQAAHSTLLEVAHGLSVSELAAHWQFADSSHFIRSFKKTYGQTPTEYARSTGLAES